MPTCALSHDLNLSYTVLGNPTFKKTVIFLHGIMGSKKNLHSFVLKFAASHPDWTALVFDLRNHGESTKNAKPYSVQAAAKDIALAVHELHIVPQAIVGHSFGGKVALLAAEHIVSIEQVWVWDSAPEAVTALRPLQDEDSFTALQVMDILDQLPWPLPSRAVVAKALEAHGVSKGIALWMTTNLEPVVGGFKLVFLVPNLKEMLLSYLKLDLWPLVAQLAREKQVHLVAASRGGRLGEGHRQTLYRLAPEGAYFHVVENAGHFLHSDNPTALLGLMSDYFA